MRSEAVGREDDGGAPFHPHPLRVQLRQPPLLRHVGGSAVKNQFYYKKLPIGGVVYMALYGIESRRLYP